MICGRCDEGVYRLLDAEPCRSRSPMRGSRRPSARWLSSRRSKVLISRGAAIQRAG